MRPRDLSAHTPYAAGRGIEEVAREVGMDPADLVKLSSNENPLGPSPKATEAVRAAADGVNTYPKADHADLRAKIADRWGLAAEQVWLGNGGDGALDYLSRALLDPGDEVLTPDPGFAYYAMSTRYHHGEVNSYPLHKSEDFAQRPANVLDAYDGERIVYLITPHSPTGSEISHDAVLEIADAVDDDTFVLVDEAYGAYTDQPSAVPLMDGRDDIGVLRTFSKSYGLAGLRKPVHVLPLDASKDLLALLLRGAGLLDLSLHSLHERGRQLSIHIRIPPLRSGLSCRRPRRLRSRSSTGLSRRRRTPSGRWCPGCPGPSRRP